MREPDTSLIHSGGQGTTTGEAASAQAELSHDSALVERLSTDEVFRTGWMMCCFVVPEPPWMSMGHTIYSRVKKLARTAYVEWEDRYVHIANYGTTLELYYDMDRTSIGGWVGMCDTRGQSRVAAMAASIRKAAYRDYVLNYLQRCLLGEGLLLKKESNNGGALVPPIWRPNAD